MLVTSLVAELSFNGPEDVTDSLSQQQLWCQAVTSAFHWRSDHRSLIPAQVSSSNVTTPPPQPTAKSEQPNSFVPPLELILNHLPICLVHPRTHTRTHANTLINLDSCIEKYSSCLCLEFVASGGLMTEKRPVQTQTHFPFLQKSAVK